MNDWMITPFHARSYFPEVLTLDHKIQIFYERVTGWQLNIADMVINGIMYDFNQSRVTVQIKDSGFAILNILLSYFEMVAKYKAGYCGKGQSGPYFKEGFKMVFPEFEKFSWLPAKMYSNVRCGLYHHGMTEEGIGLMDGDFPPITILKDKRLIINPHALVLRLKEHFQIYMKQLESDKDFRLNFEKRFDNDNR